MTAIILKSGRRITVKADDYAENPRRLFDKRGRFVAESSRFEFGADQTFSRSEVLEMEHEFITENWQVFPVYACVRDGVVLSLDAFAGARGTGQIGFLAFPEEFPNAKKEAALALAELNAWLSGGIFCAYVETAKGFDSEIDDCLSGIYAAGEREAAQLAAEQLDLTKGERSELIARLGEF